MYLSRQGLYAIHVVVVAITVESKTQNQINYFLLKMDGGGMYSDREYLNTCT